MKYTRQLYEKIVKFQSSDLTLSSTMKTKNIYSFVMQSIKKDTTLSPHIENHSGKTYVVGGGTRGIGYSIAEKIICKGGNVALIGKTTKPHAKLDNTIYTAESKLNKYAKKEYNNKCRAIHCDIREPSQIHKSMYKIKEEFGGIDGVILNASAISLENTLNQSVKSIQLMTNVNILGTYLLGQSCIKEMTGSNKHGHIIIIAPPIQMLYTDHWWTNHMYYTMSKFNMTLMARFWDKEFPHIAVNTLWPRTTIDTAPVRNLLGGSEMVNLSRKPDIMGDAAEAILSTDPLLCHGKNFIDDEVLVSLDKDIEKYRINPNIEEKELMPDFFC